MSEKMFDFVTYISKFIGRPYVWGGDGSGKFCGGFDCSGLVIEGLKCAGLLPAVGDWTAQGLRERLTKDNWCSVPPECAERGDVVFYGPQNKVSHVAIFVGDGCVIEAGGGGSDCKNASFSTGMVRIRPLTSRKDVVCVLRHYG